MPRLCAGCACAGVATSQQKGRLRMSTPINIVITAFYKNDGGRVEITCRYWEDLTRALYNVRRDTDLECVVMHIYDEQGNKKHFDLI